MKSRMVDYYMRIAEQTAQLSRARRLQVGCVIVKNDNIISFGWNGTPPGWDNDCEYRDYCVSRDFTGNYFPGTEDEYPFEDDRGRYRLKTRPEVIHAEANALMKMCRTHESSQDAALFLTHAPCIDCAKLVASSGINSVYYRSQYRNQDGIDFLARSQIDCQQV
jgi:dCMP deaminase